MLKSWGATYTRGRLIRESLRYLKCSYAQSNSNQNVHVVVDPVYQGVITALKKRQKCFPVHFPLQTNLKDNDGRAGNLTLRFRWFFPTKYPRMGQDFFLSGLNPSDQNRRPSCRAGGLDPRCPFAPLRCTVGNCPPAGCWSRIRQTFYNTLQAPTQKVAQK